MPLGCAVKPESMGGSSEVKESRSSELNWKNKFWALRWDEEYFPAVEVCVVVRPVAIEFSVARVDSDGWRMEKSTQERL